MEGGLTMSNITGLLESGSWAGRSCYVVGGGPSLRGFDFERIQGKLSIGVNRAYEYCDPTILLALDARFYRWIYEGKYGEGAIRKIEAFKGTKAGIRVSRDHIPGIIQIKGLGVSGPIVPIEEGLYHGNNSGYAAVALALALGASPVYVLGIDLRYDGDVTHFHEGHPEKTREIDLFKKCLGPFEDLSRTPIGLTSVKLVNLQWPERNFSRISGLFDEVNIQFAIDSFKEGT